MGNDTAAVDLQESQGSSTQQPSQSTGQNADRTLDEILAHSSTDVIQAFAESIKQRAIEEAVKTEEFRRELKRRLIRALLRTYVWANARLLRETETGEGELAQGVQGLLSLERDQGRSSLPTRSIMDRLRGRLVELMAAVSRAVEMFGE